MRFKPTDLGVALIDGYNSIGEVGLTMRALEQCRHPGKEAIVCNEYAVEYCRLAPKNEPCLP